MLIVYDFEVYPHDWCVVFKPMDKDFRVFWNDNKSLQQFMSQNSHHVFIGFNTKWYDQYIMSAACSDWTPEEIKQLNDWIIGGNQGWNFPKKLYYKFNNADIRDDMQQGLSLKSIEGHFGMNIQETEVDFNKEHLTSEDMNLIEEYCKHDVEATERLVKERKDYLDNKVFLGKQKGIQEPVALSMTNAKLTAAYLGAERKHTYNDEREYVYPDNLLHNWIPASVHSFFNRLYDKSLSDEEVFSEKLDLTIGDCQVVLGFGGIHGAIPNYIGESTEDTMLINEDVGSYYPHLITINGYVSRAMANPDDYATMLDTRMTAKKEGNKALANALKLVCNTTYGAMGNQYNDLYDPLMMRSVCISGQLYLLELAEHFYRGIKNLIIVQLNTDGIMIQFPKSAYEQVTAICKEWQERTGFELEEDQIAKVVQKDVNNYIEVQTDGSVKKKGGYLVRGVSSAGAWKINNTATIVADAITEYLINGTPVEDTINACDDILAFQFIAKGGSTYDYCFKESYGNQVRVQNCNRVYASPDPFEGTVYKVKGSRAEKIQDIPDHCIIDNDNHLTVEDIDKQFYIDMAIRKVNDFTQGRRNTKMAKATPATEQNVPTNLNTFQKLLVARKKFLEANIKKSGKNMQLTYKYFELDDIIPTITNIFNEVGLLALVTYDQFVARMTIVNVDNPADERIVFEAPMTELPTNKAVTAIQALGSVETYQRRYLYMTALDICEPDTLDGGELVKKTAPVQAEKAKETKTEEVQLSSDSTASDAQVKQIKKAARALIKADPSKKEFVALLQVNTKNFTEMTKKDAEDILKELAKNIKEVTEGGKA